MLPHLRQSLTWILAAAGKAMGTREYVGAPDNRSLSDDGLYIAIVNKALSEPRVFREFKRHPHYRKILEHTTYRRGLAYLEVIRAQAPDFLDRIDELKANDLVGGSSKMHYEGIGEISPSTLRYIKVASDLRQLFGAHIGERVAEIGVGYGGQMLIADKLLSFSEYHLFDLPPVLTLASKYLECHNLKSSYQLKTLNQHPGGVEYDLVVSNYAFSELPSKLQLQYLKKIMCRAKKGYLIMNSGTKDSIFQQDKLLVSELREFLPLFQVAPEEPLSSPGNFLITWGTAHPQST